MSFVLGVMFFTLGLSLLFVGAKTGHGEWAAGAFCA